MLQGAYFPREDQLAGCCQIPSPGAQAAGVCPRSGSRGKPVEIQTVKALLTERALTRLGRSPHWFCPDPGCEVVYFDADGATYVKADVRVPVWQKEAFGSRVICYCFGENEADIRAEVEEVGRSDAVQRVRKHIAAGRCACKIRNPRGVCCLGDVSAAVKRFASAIQRVPSETVR